MLKWLQPGLWMFAAQPDEVKFFEANLYSLQQGQLSSFSLFSIQTREFKKTCSCDSIRGIAICFKTRVKPSYRIWYFHLHFRVLCTMGTCRVISGWWVALRLGQFNHMCLYLLDMFPSELVASTSSLSCLLTQSLVCGFARGPKCLVASGPMRPTIFDPRNLHLLTSGAERDPGAPNSSMALDNLSKSSSLQSPEVSWVKEKSKIREVNQKSENPTLSSYRSRFSPSNCQECINQPQQPTAFW